MSRKTTCIGCLKALISERNALVSRLSQSEANEHGFVDIEGDQSNMNMRIEELNTRIDTHTKGVWDCKGVRTKKPTICRL